MKLLRLAVVAVGILSAATAFAGEGLLGIQITNGTGDFYSPDDPTGPGYLSAYQSPEIGIGLQYWRLMTQDYAFNVSAGIGFFNEKEQPGDALASNSPDLKYTQSSWNVRVGGDRAVKISDRAIVYFGPGLEMWSGKAKFENFGSGLTPDSYESQNVMRFGISGRVGGAMMLSDAVGFNCQIGRYVGYASAEEKGAKTTWWPSGFQASGGVVFRMP